MAAASYTAASAAVDTEGLEGYGGDDEDLDDGDLELLRSAPPPVFRSAGPPQSAPVSEVARPSESRSDAAAVGLAAVERKLRWAATQLEPCEDILRCEQLVKLIEQCSSSAAAIAASSRLH